MKRLTLQFGLLGLFSLLTVTLGASGQRAAYATAPVIGQSTSTFVVLGTWQDSKVDLYTDLSGAPSQNDILITDQSYLRPDWTIKVDEEKMCIRTLTEGGYGQPDHMLVWRGCGTSVFSHSAGAAIQGHTVTVDVLAQNVPGPNGLGGFEVHLTVPPETQFIKAAIDTTWLTSTGRTDPWCDSPALFDGTWSFRCWTLNPTPPGPTGTGLVARVTLLPPQSLGTAVVSLAGSQLGDITGADLHATPADIRIITIACPDANLDGKVSVSDLTITARSSNARGEDSLATLAGSITTTATQIPITQVGLLQFNDTIAIDAELMTVQSIGTEPPTITVTRANQSTPARAHTAGAIVFRGTYPSIITGTYNYTWPRDPNHDYRVTVSDQTIMARVSGLTCPVP